LETLQGSRSAEDQHAESRPSAVKIFEREKLPCRLSREWCQIELNGLPVVLHGLEAEPILESDVLGLAPIAATAEMVQTHIFSMRALRLLLA
jgi:hypothetical protein